MAEDFSDRLTLPLLHPGQAQKEVFHNEALTLLDMLVQAKVESADLVVPPSSPSAGQCWIVASGATGVWSGHDHAIAGWTAGGWRFAAPVAGMRVWVGDRGHAVEYISGAWCDEGARADGFYVAGDRVLSGRQTAIADVAGGSAPDAEARAAINAILAMLRMHGMIAMA